MTVSIETSLTVAEGDGAQTNFPFVFKMADTADLKVDHVADYQTENAVVTPLTQGVDFTSTGGLEENSGSVDYPVSGDPLAVGDALIIYRDTPLLQDDDITNGARFYPEVHEGVWDRLTLMIQENRDRITSLEQRVDDIDDGGEGPGPGDCCPPDDGNHNDPYVSDDDRTDWDDAANKSHTHSNKTVLDGITQPGVDAWDATAAIVKDDGPGTNFLADDGTYKAGGPGGGDGIAGPNSASLDQIATYTNENQLAEPGANQIKAKDGTFTWSDGATVTRTGGVFIFADPNGAVVQVGSGSAFITLDASNGSALSVVATGAPIEVTSDTSYSDTQGRFRPVAVAGFRLPPAAEAVAGHPIQASNTPADGGAFDVGVFDTSSNTSPSPVVGYPAGA